MSDFGNLGIDLTNVGLWEFGHRLKIQCGQILALPVSSSEYLAFFIINVLIIFHLMQWTPCLVFECWQLLHVYQQKEISLEACEVDHKDETYWAPILERSATVFTVGNKFCGSEDIYLKLWNRKMLIIHTIKGFGQGEGLTSVCFQMSLTTDRISEKPCRKCAPCKAHPMKDSVSTPKHRQAGLKRISYMYLANVHACRL